MDLNESLIRYALETDSIICEDEDGIYFGDPDNPDHVKEQIPFPDSITLYFND